MTKQYFTALAAYNSWANDKAMDWLSQISDEQWEQTLTSSFSSLRQTAVHIASAEKIWVDFWTKAPTPTYLSSHFDGAKNELLDIWKTASAEMHNFIKNCPEENFTDVVTFVYPSGGLGQLHYWQTFAHSINHSTYHRGQLVTLLRQNGSTKFSSVDLATYYLTQMFPLA
ncbi:MAG: DinB family protein [Bacteroidota bacterium]|nr:DinB family protein [Bacteroidota bacterium]